MKATATAPRRSLGWLAVLPCALALAWATWLLHMRGQLNLENHLARNVPLPFAPIGRPALHPDGRIFIVTAQSQIVSINQDGHLLWNKLLPGPVLPQPVLVTSRLLVLQGRNGTLYGYTPGGELHFTAHDNCDGSVLPAADEDGNLYVLDRDGALLGLDREGRQRFRGNPGLNIERHIIVTASGLLGAGGDGQRHEVFLSARDGTVEARLSLKAPAVGLSLSPLGDELGAVSSGAEVLTLDRNLAVLRRLTLPGPLLSAPLLTADGAVYALVQGAAEVTLCRADGAKGAAKGGIPGDAGTLAWCVPAAGGTEAGLVPGPLLGRDGRIYIAFSADQTLLPSYHGVLSVAPDGRGYRQELPGPVAPFGLTLGWTGGVLAIAQGQRYVWLLEGGTDGTTAPYHPWPMPAGNPAGSSRPWPETP